jgi:hypothetical protein
MVVPPGVAAPRPGAFTGTVRLAQKGEIKELKGKETIGN